MERRVGWGITTVTGTSRPDYSVFDSRAMQAASKLTNVVLGNETITPGSDLERQLEILIGDVLDVIVYGGVFNEGSPDYVNDENYVMDEYAVLLELAAHFTSTGWKDLDYYNPLPYAYINKRAEPCTADGRFGWVRDGGKKHHDGVDLGTSPLTPVNVGTPVYAVWAGTAKEVRQVSKKDKTKLDGYGIQTRLYLPAAKTKYYFIYAHLSSGVTDRLERSEVAGYVGRTGNLPCDDAKTHLHFEVKDPADWDITVDPKSVSTNFQWTQED